MPSKKAERPLLSAADALAQLVPLVDQYLGCIQALDEANFYGDTEEASRANKRAEDVYSKLVLALDDAGRTLTT